jgi:3-dehydroquinate synthase
MKTLDIKGGTGYSTLIIGESINNLSNYVSAEKVIIITDTNVGGLYMERFPDWNVIEIGTGEKIKTLDTMKDIYDQLIGFEADRSSYVVGIGGGIVCDITGFAASTYMRGIDFGFVATTLLAQVDASVGGKNGVNLGGYKNMVGVFNQPDFVLCDMSLLKSLPREELLCGLAEIVKHGAIADSGLFKFLEANAERALGLKPDVIERLVYDSVVIKSGVVNRDERECGERKKLNFGHTFGHGLEKVTGIPHGEAISIGMVVAARISSKICGLPEADVKRVESLLTALGLPTSLNCDMNNVLDALKKDKKRKGDSIDLILLDRIGNAIIKKISFQKLEKAIIQCTN